MHKYELRANSYDYAMPAMRPRATLIGPENQRSRRGDGSYAPHCGLDRRLGALPPPLGVYVLLAMS